MRMGANQASSELDAIVERLRNGRCVLCAGSRLGGDGTYRSLVEKLLGGLPGIDQADAQRALEKRPLAAAGFVRRRLGDRFVPELKLASTEAGELSEAVKIFGTLPF